MTYSSTALGAEQTDRRAQARAIYAEAQRLYDAGDYSTAVKAFHRAYQTYSLPTVLVAIAQSYREIGENERAKQFAQRYLYADPSGPQAEQARQIKSDAEAALQAPSSPEVPASVRAPAQPLPPADDAYPTRATRGIFAITAVGLVGLIGVGYYMTKRRQPVRRNRRRRRRRTSRRR